VPAFPIICEIGDIIVGAGTGEQFEKEILSLDLPAGEHLPIVDVSAEGWELSVDHMVITPLTIKKRWTKKEVISLFNNSSLAKKSQVEYSMKSLSSKRFDKILTELVEHIRRLNQANRGKDRPSGS